MNIQELPVVKSVGEVGYKFIVVRVFEINSKEEKNVDVVRAHQDCEYHSDIFDWFKREEIKGTGLMCGCIGGGRIRFDANNKTIWICGHSGSYGKEPNRARTVAMLQEAYPKYKISERKFDE